MMNLWHRASKYGFHSCIMEKHVCFENEPRHEISNNVICATSKASDQLAHMRSLSRTFASRLNILGVLSY